jgi:hypothetical protein
MHVTIQLPNVGNTPVVMVAFSLTGGFVLLVLGGESLVRGSVAAARRLGASSLLIGLTIVGVGTSLPELSHRFWPVGAINRTSPWVTSPAATFSMSLAFSA